MKISCHKLTNCPASLSITSLDLGHGRMLSGRTNLYVLNRDAELMFMFILVVLFTLRLSAVEWEN
jgi:hypothetical protein